MSLVAVALIPIVVVTALLIWYAVVSSLESTGELTVLFLLIAVIVVASILAGLLLTAVVAYGVAEHYLGSKIAIGSTFQFVLRRLGSLVGAVFPVGLAVFAMAITIIGIPAAVYFGVTWAFVLQVVVLVQELAQCERIGLFLAEELCSP